MPDHVHIMISIPPKHAVAQVVGYIKGKSAIHIARSYAGRRRNFVGQHFWARGYFVSTVGATKRPFLSTSATRKGSNSEKNSCGCSELSPL
jgi:REP element-mobilizing transposase RayT